MLNTIFKRFSSIKNVRGREIIDSRGHPTVEAEVETSKGVFRAAVLNSFKIILRYQVAHQLAFTKLLN